MNRKRIICIILSLALIAQSSIIAFADSEPTAIMQSFSISSSTIESVSATAYDSGVYLRWSGFSGAQSYTVYRRISTENSWTTVAQLSATSYIDNTTDGGKEYIYAVSAIITSGGVTNETDKQESSAVLAYPMKAKNVKLKAADNRVLASWDSVAGASSYTLYRKIADDTSSWFQVASNLTSCSYYDDGVSGDTEYTYAVRATSLYVGGTINSAWSFSETNITLPLFVNPTSKVSVSSDNSGALITWTTVKSADYYRIYRREHDNSQWTLISDNNSGISFKDTSVAGADTYIYAVESVADKQTNISVSKKVESDEIYVGPFTPNLSVSKTSDHYVELSWEKKLGVSYYVLYRKAVSSSAWSELASGVTGNSYMDISLESGTVYNYAIKSITVEADGTKKNGKFNISNDTASISGNSYVYDVTEKCFGADGSDKLSDYTAIQTVLYKAKKATKDNPITVVFPAGTYYIDNTLLVSSYTNLKLDENAHIIRTDSSKPMLIGIHYNANGNICSGKECTHSGYTQLQNVTISGGTWDGNISGSADNLTVLFSFAHTSGLTIKNTELADCCGMHMINVDAGSDLTFDNIKFSNFLNNTASGTTDKDSYSREALHFDYITTDSDTSAAPAENLGCKNVSVIDCQFVNCVSGIGTHNVYKDLYSDGVTIKGNTFTNISNNCINLANFSNVKIQSNNVTTANIFTSLNGCSGDIDDNTLNDIKNQGILTTNNCKVTINNNDIYINNTTVEKPIGILVDNSSASILTNNLYVQNADIAVSISNSNVTAEGNYFSSGNMGVFASGGENDGLVSISNNTFFCYSYAFMANSCATKLNFSNNNIDLMPNSNLQYCRGAKLLSCKNTSVIDNNTIEKFGYSAFEVVNSSSAELTNNTISDGVSVASSNAVGARIDSSDNCKVSSNNITDIIGKGIEIYNSSDIISEENTINNCSTYGIAATNVKNITVKKNNVAKSVNFDIAVTGNSTGTVSNNTVDKTGIYGVAGVNITSNGRNLKYCTLNKLSDQLYSATAIEPDVVIHNGTELLKKDVDYTLEYTNNLNLGTAMVTIKGIGIYTDSISTSFSIVTPIPIITALQPNKFGIIVSWKQLPFDYYSIYRSDVSKGGWTLIASNVKGTNYSDNTVKSFTTYTYAMKGYRKTADGNIVISAWSGTSLTALTAELTPTNPAITGLSTVSTGVKITWTASTNADYYTVYRSESGSGKWATVGTKVTGTSFTDTSVKAGTKYTYAMKAHKVSSSGSVFNSGWSGTTLTVTTKEAAPSNPAITALSAASNGVKITWTASTNADYYTVYRSESGSGKWTTVGTKVTGTSFTDTSVKAGTKYTYAMKAHKVSSSVSVLNSGWSGTTLTVTAKDTTPSNPAITALSAASNGVKITWTASTNADYYTVYRSESGSGKWTTVGTKVTGTSFTDTSVKAGTKYTYAMKAHKVSSSGSVLNSGWSGTTLTVTA